MQRKKFFDFRLGSIALPMLVLAACGGGDGAGIAPVNPAPKVESIQPANAVVGQAKEFTVMGQNLPLTAVLSLKDGVCQTPTARTSTGFKVTCTPSGPAGGKLLTVATDLQANGGTVIDSTHSVDVAASAPPIGIPSVTSIMPRTATVNVPVTLTVTGQDIPLTAVLSMADAACDAPTAQTAAGFSTTCTAATAGAKLVTVRTAAAASGGTVIDSTRSITVVAVLPDTGITASQCYAAGSNALVSCTSAAAIALNDKQDGMVGRDVSNADNSDGKLGLSYTKLDANGNPLPASAVNWSCVKDNLTGLTWEVKTADGGLRDMYKTYTNYDDVTQAQKWNGSAWVKPTQADIDIATNTRGFVTAVNAASLCGHADWRLPSADELQDILDYSVVLRPKVDSAWFINTPDYGYWSSSPYADDAGGAWYVSFSQGYVNYDSYRLSRYAVRLVR